MRERPRSPNIPFYATKASGREVTFSSEKMEEVQPLSRTLKPEKVTVKVKPEAAETLQPRVGLGGLAFSIREGEIYGLLGPNFFPSFSGKPRAPR